MFLGPRATDRLFETFALGGGELFAQKPSIFPEVPSSYMTSVETPPAAPAPPDGREGWSIEKAKALFATLSEGGSVNMPFGPTFWARGFGGCVDKFGTPWMVNSK